jgi:hypothetical protein
VAVRKETYSSKLVLKDVVSGLPKVGRVPVAPPNKKRSKVTSFFFGCIVVRPPGNH